MWEMIKKDPLIKTVVVSVLGVLAFGFAFNIMFGTRGEMGNAMGMGAGYSIISMMWYTLTLLMKILLIVILITTIIVCIKLIKKYVNNEQTNLVQFLKEESSVRLVIVSSFLLIILNILSIIISGTGGSRYHGSNGMNNNSVYFMGGYQYNTEVTFILLGLIKIVLIFSFIGLVISLFGCFKEGDLNKILTSKNKKQTCANCGTETTEQFNYCPDCGKSMKIICENCGTEIKNGWSCCPNCGKDINNLEKKSTVETNAKEEQNEETAEVKGKLQD